MKLRNKKTGEIVETDYMFGVSIPTTKTFGCKSYDQIAAYGSLAELNEDWEDYTPAEPLIKDEEIRKVVRAWAKLVSSAQVRYAIHDGSLYTYSDCIMPFSISFPAQLGLDEMTDYTIAELCGEVEE